MAKKKNPKVRFLGGYAARKNLLGILAYPVGYGFRSKASAKDPTNRKLLEKYLKQIRSKK